MTKQPSQAAKYLFGSLQLDPLVDADKIIARREIVLGVRKPVAAGQQTESDTQVDQSALRRNLKSRIDSLRAEFWTISAAQLGTQLEGLPVSKFPELKASADRLRLMVSYRGQFSDFGQEKSKSINLWNTLKRIVIMPPRDAGQLKEKYLRSISNSKNVKVIATAKLIRKKYPQLYQLESDWFDQIIGTKPQLQNVEDSYEGVESDFEIPLWVIWIAVVIGLRVLWGVLRSWN